MHNRRAVRATNFKKQSDATIPNAAQQQSVTHPSDLDDLIAMRMHRVLRHSLISLAVLGATRWQCRRSGRDGHRCRHRIPAHSCCSVPVARCGVIARSECSCMSACSSWVQWLHRRWVKRLQRLRLRFGRALAFPRRCCSCRRAVICSSEGRHPRCISVCMRWSRVRCHRLPQMNRTRRVGGGSGSGRTARSWLLLLLRRRLWLWSNGMSSGRTRHGARMVQQLPAASLSVGMHGGRTHTAR